MHEQFEKLKKDYESIIDISLSGNDAMDIRGHGQNPKY